MIYASLVFSVLALAQTTPLDRDAADVANSYFETVMKEWKVPARSGAGSSYRELKDIQCLAPAGQKIACSATAESGKGNGEKKIKIPAAETHNFLLNVRRLIKAQNLSVRSSATEFRLSSLACQSGSDDEGAKSTNCVVAQQKAAAAAKGVKASRPQAEYDRGEDTFPDAVDAR